MKAPELRRILMASLRAASIAAALLALSGASLPLPTRARTLVLLIDVSNSIGREGIEASRRAALSLIGSLDRRDRVGTMAFAGRPSLVSPPLEPEAAARVLEAAQLTAPSPESTELSSALAAARELAAGSPGSATVYLFSDGRATGGSPLAAAKVHEGPRVVVDSVPSGAPATGLVARELSVPESAHPGERLAVAWRLFSDRARKISYELRVDGVVVARAGASLSAGANELPLAVDAGSPGRHSLLVTARAAGEAPLAAGAASAGAYLDVGGAARVLVVSTRESPIAAALRAQGMEVETGGPEALPEEGAGYAGRSALVLDDLPALDMTEEQQARLQDYVAGGGALLVVGGDSSLGRGEYYATPLEELLPVETDTRERLLFTRTRLLFVIDHSGSMGEETGGETKQMVAMRGVAASIAELNPLDEVGIIGFDSVPSWVLPFTPAGQRQRILASLSGLGEGGGTDLSVALDEALRGFGEPGPTRRHAIVLTDGLTPEADFKGLARRFTEAGVSLSAIAIGDEVNEGLLRSLAQDAGGRYYRAKGNEVPRLIEKETLRMTRDLMQEGRIETRTREGGALVEGLGDPPPGVSGYLLTKPKALARVELEAREEGGGGPWDPLLATWRYGSGRVAVFTSDSGRRWLSSWLGGRAYNRLWSQTLRSLESSAPDSSLRASASGEGGRIHVTVEALGPGQRSATGLHLVGRADSKGSSTATAGGFDFEETAPGRYEAYAVPGATGLVGLDILEPSSGARASTWAWNPPGLESPGLGPDLAALALVASSSGGGLLAPGRLEPPAVLTTWRYASLRLPLLVLAALCLVLELYLRSTMTGQIHRALAALRSWWASQKATALASATRRWPEASPAQEADSERRYMEMQRRLAEHVARRYEPRGDR